METIDMRKKIEKRADGKIATKKRNGKPKRISATAEQCNAAFREATRENTDKIRERNSAPQTSHRITPFGMVREATGGRNKVEKIQDMSRQGFIEIERENGRKGRTCMSLGK